jgi:hypothetical protein
MFPSRQPNGRDKLWGIFELWSTHDAPVDEGFYGGYFGPSAAYHVSRLTRYWYRLRWLTRNTAYGWSYLLFSIPTGTGFQWKGLSKTYFGFYNDFNIGYKHHAGFAKDDLAGRIIGIRKTIIV